jgi:hypothetical protein
MAAAQSAPVRTTEFSVNVNGRYDSNVARTDEASAILRGLDREDFVVTPSLNVNIERPIGTNSVFLQGLVGYDIHTRNSQLDRERIQLSGGGDFGVGPCRITPSASIGRFQSDLADIVIENGVIAADIRNVQTTQRYNSGLTCGGPFGPRPFIEVGYTQGRSSNDLRSIAEYDSWNYVGGLSYSAPALGELRLFASQNDTDLVGQPLLGGGVNGYRSNAIGLDYTREVGTRLTLDGSISYSKLRPRFGGERFSGLTWNLAATLLISDQLQLTALIGRELSNSLASNAAYTVNQPYGLRMRYAVSDRLQLNGGLSITRTRYSFPTIPTVDFISRETRRSYDLGVSYQLGQRLRLTVAGGRAERSANGSIFDYNSNFVTAGIGMTF